MKELTNGRFRGLRGEFGHLGLFPVIRWREIGRGTWSNGAYPFARRIARLAEAKLLSMVMLFLLTAYEEISVRLVLRAHQRALTLVNDPK